MLHTLHPGELEAVRQTVDWRDIRDAYGAAYAGVFGRNIRPDPLALLLAHSALETGRWKAGLWNWNLGNIKASTSYADKIGNYHQYYRLNEYLRQPDGSYRYEWFDPPHPQTRMRAYLTSGAGAAEKIRFLGTASNPARGNRYACAWEALEEADPTDFSHELRAAGYYTALEAPYTRAVVSLFSEFCDKLDAEPYVRQPAVNSPPLDANDVHTHSPLTQIDLAQVWIGQPMLGLPDDIFADLQRMKVEDVR